MSRKSQQAQALAAEAMPFRWNRASVKDLLKNPDRLDKQEHARAWIQQHGGLSAVRAFLRSLPLTEQKKKLLTVILDFPNGTAVRHADELNIDRATYFLWLPPLADTLADHLNAWEIEGPATRTSVVRKLPAQLTSIVGRAHEIAEICTLLQSRDVRLITLIGPGGIGKTRLALQAAEELFDEFSDGVCFVPLASIHDARLVAATIAQTLGLQETAGQDIVHTLKHHLCSKHMLLVIDNFEHVTAAAPLVADLLVAAPLLKILVTSREVLHLYGEHEFVVPPLPVPASAQQLSYEQLLDHEVIRLFLVRAQAAKSDFKLTNANTDAIVAICRCLDGIPLAIELAATQVKWYSPQVLAKRLVDRLGVLATESHNLPERHRTLRQTLNWSYQLLSPDEQQLFSRMGVFVGSWDTAAARALYCSQPPGAPDLQTRLSALVDKSLMRCVEIASGETRFEMLETIREYALERLVATGEEQCMRQRHAAYYLTIVEQAEPELIGTQQQVWLDRLDIEHDNLRASLDWLFRYGKSALAVRLAAGLWRFWLARGHLSEGRRWLEAALAEDDGLPQIRAKVLLGLGGLARAQGDYQIARAYLQESLSLYRGDTDKQGLVAVLNNLGRVEQDDGDYQAARAYYQESLALYQSLGDLRGISMVFNNLGSLEYYQGNLQAACRHLEESLVICRSLHDMEGIGTALNNLGTLKQEQGEYQAARAYLEESLSLYDVLGDRQGTGMVLINLAVIAREQEQYRAARDYLEQSLAIYRALGDKRGLLLCLAEFAYLEAKQHRWYPAAQLLFATESLSKRIAANMHELTSQPIYTWAVDTIQAHLDDLTACALRSAAEHITIEQAVEYACSSS